MLISVGEAHDFVFDRRAVAWADTFDHPCIHWATIEVTADHIMGFLVGMSDITRHLLGMLGRIAHKREYRHWVIAMLLRQHTKVDSSSINTRWCPGFQTTNAQRQFTQTARKRNGRRITSTATAVIIQTDMNFTVEERPNGEHDGFGTERQSHLGNSTDHAIVFDNKIFNRLLEDHQVRLVLQRRTYRLTVEHTIRLSSGSANRRSFACV